MTETARLMPPRDFSLDDPEDTELYRPTDEELRNWKTGELLIDELKAKIKGRQGEQVLVTTKESNYSKLSPGLYDRFKLGVLTDGEVQKKEGGLVNVVFLSGDLTLPTTRHADYNGAVYHQGWNLKEEPLDISSLSLYFWRKEGESGHGKVIDIGEWTRGKTGIFIGEDEIINFFKIGWLSERDICIMKARQEDFSNVFNNEYFEALRVLGLPPPEQVKQLYREHFHTRKTKLIDGIESLIAKNRRLGRRITTVFDHVGYYPGLDNVAAVLHTGDDRRYVKDGVERIKTMLLEGIVLGMHKEDTVLMINGRIPVHSTEYMETMCKAYDVEIPKS